jgi:hypothetical protein
VASLGRADVPLAPIAIEALFAWAPELQRQPSGGVCSVLIPNPASGGAGPYVPGGPVFVSSSGVSR